MKIAAGLARVLAPILAGALASMATSGFASAQKFPDRPVHFIVPYAVGGGTDIIARVVGQKLSELGRGQPVVIDQPAGRGQHGGDRGRRQGGRPTGTRC